MKYYAVTDDPNELMHYGILGMKWGRRRTPEQLGHPRHTGSRKRSAAYKKAQSKLGKMMKSGIKKAEAHWKEYNSPKAKEARFMKKAMQQARNGTLKYGKLTDDQVRRVTDRLYLERQARQLGSTENPRYTKRLKSAIGEGIIRGIGGGTGAYIEERFRGRGRTTAEIKANKRMAKYNNSLAGQRAARREAAAEQRKAYYKQQAEEGQLHSRLGKAASLGILAVADPKNVIFTEERARIKSGFTQKSRAQVLSAKRASDKEEERKKRQEEARDRSYYTNLGKLQAEREMGITSKSSSTSSKVVSSTSSEPKAIVRRSTPRVVSHVPKRDRGKFRGRRS